MQVVGIIVHHSACPSINGKGYDFYVTASGTIIPSPYRIDPSFIHICLEGDFSGPHTAELPETKEQLFLFLKLAIRLAEAFGFEPGDLFSHANECPGPHFPWSQLVISGKDRYH